GARAGSPGAQDTMKWLIDCNMIAVPPQPGLPALQWPGPAHADVPVKENDEPLVPLTGVIKTHPVYSWLGFVHGPGTMQLRAGVLERLERAARGLPADFEIVVIERAHQRCVPNGRAVVRHQAKQTCPIRTVILAHGRKDSPDTKFTHSLSPFGSPCRGGALHTKTWPACLS